MGHSINLEEITELPYILEPNPHPFYSFRGLKNQMRITIACGLDLRSRAGFWKNYGAAVRAVRTIQYNNLLFYLLLIIIYYSSDSPSSLITKLLSMLRRDCSRLLRKTPGAASDFNALVTSDIIQSVTLWTRGG
jgi:hypothetical protein